MNENSESKVTVNKNQYKDNKPLELNPNKKHCILYLPKHTIYVTEAASISLNTIISAQEARVRAFHDAADDIFNVHMQKCMQRRFSTRVL
jgi:hypothetical protein